MKSINLDSEIETITNCLYSAVHSASKANTIECFHEYLRLRSEMNKKYGDIACIKLSEALRKRFDDDDVSSVGLDAKDLICVPLVRMQQHAVGHGGFHSGAIG
jgi:hypothetical protein